MSIMAVAWLAACPASQSSRCKELCHSMVKCIETLEATDVDIDETECTATCTALERDTEGKKLVDEHARCVASAGDDCEALLACQ